MSLSYIALSRKLSPNILHDRSYCLVTQHTEMPEVPLDDKLRPVCSVNTSLVVRYKNP